jgi:ketosteroid isomerase-like protein
VLSRNAAVATGTYRIPHLNPRNQPHVLGGAMTMVFRRQGGRWVVIQEHLSDTPQTSDSTNSTATHDQH